MTDVDGLIQWMTHRGQGRWESFKEIVLDVYSGDEEPPKPLWVANTLSRMGVGEFFVDGSNRWRTFAPLIAGTSDGQAVVVGGRTSSFSNQLRSAAAAEDIDIFEEPLQWGLKKVRLYALADESLGRVAHAAGIPFVPHAADKLVRQLPTIIERVSNGQIVRPPRNWAVESFDFSTFQWVDRDIARSAKDFTPSRGVPKRTMFERTDGSFVQMDRRGSVYGAAYDQSIGLLTYDPEHSTLSVPSSAPLPADMERSATLCSGNLPSRQHGLTVFADVRWSVASILLALTGCPLPMSLDESGRTGR